MANIKRLLPGGADGHPFVGAALADEIATVLFECAGYEAIGKAAGLDPDFVTSLSAQRPDIAFQALVCELDRVNYTLLDLAKHFNASSDEMLKRLGARLVVATFGTRRSQPQQDDAAPAKKPQ